MKNTFTACLLFFLGLCAARAQQTLTSYQATINAQSPAFYFTFDGGNLTDATGHGVTLIPNATISYVNYGLDAWGNVTNTAVFPFKSDYLNASSQGIISGGGAAGNNPTTQAATGAISFLFRTPDPGTNNPGYLCIFSAGSGTTTDNALSLLIENNKLTNSAGSNNFPDSLKLRFGNASQVILSQANIVPNTWYYFALSYTESTNSNGAFVDATGTNCIGKGVWYLGPVGGMLASGLTTNAVDSVAGDGTDFFIGNETDTTHGYASGQVDEFATWTRQLSSTEVSNQFKAIPAFNPPPRGNYQGVVSAQSPSYYFKLDGNYVDSVGGTLSLKTTNGLPSVDFTYDYFGTTDCVVFFNGGDALTNNGNLLNGGGVYTGASGTGQGSISFLFRTMNSVVNQGNRYLYSAGGSPVTSNRFELFFNTFSSTAQPEELKLGFGDSSTVILATNNFTPGAWYYFAMNYNEALTNKQVNWWLGPLGTANPTLLSGTLSATNGSLAGQGSVFVIGSSTNLTANSYRNSTPGGQGRIDEFAIWHRILSGAEVTNQFNALLPAVVTANAPMLTISLSGTNVLVAWPASTDPGYTLQSSASLLAGWSAAGSPSVVGTNNVVTNAASASATFYRLSK